MAEHHEPAYENLMEIPVSAETLTPDFVSLMTKSMDFISSIIRDHARQLYSVVGPDFYTEDNTGALAKCIVTVTNNTFNKISNNFQNKIPDTTVSEFASILQFCSYGPHILLSKLLVMTLTVHMDITYSETSDHMELVNKQIDKLTTKYAPDFMEILRKTDKDNSEYKPVPEGQNAFNCDVEEFELNFGSVKEDTRHRN
jgi:hypothetical protein